MNNHSSDPILVIGHRNPDTDAICSALAYADFYHWQSGRPTQACHLDELAPETIWLLQYLKLMPPQQISDVYLRVADVIETHMPVLRPEQTLREAGLLMQEHHIRALPVTNEQQHLVGIVQSDTLAARYLEQLQLPDHINLPVELVVRTLDATLLTGDPTAMLNDRIWMATMTVDTTRRSIATGDIVIVGDQREIQQAALESGAGCLIVTDNVALDAQLLRQASSSQVIVMRTSHSPFAAALLLQQSVPIGQVMTKELGEVTINRDTMLVEAREQLRRTNLTGLAVIDDDGRLHGMLRRRHLAEQISRQVILTDHNHPEQAADGVAESQIIAIIDHHNLGGLQTIQPLAMYCEPVGCTCTLIAEQYQRYNAPLSQALAGAMLAAILSDTVQFRSPTTTMRDQAAAEWLEQQSGIAITSLAQGLFRARLPNPIPPASWWVNRDSKQFNFGDLRFSVSQVELAAIAEVMPPVEELRQALAQNASAQGLTTAYLLLTDILEQSSLLIAANPAGEALVARAFGKQLSNGFLYLPGVMSRKKQVIPPLAAAIAQQ